MVTGLTSSQQAGRGHLAASLAAEVKYTVDSSAAVGTRVLLQGAGGVLGTLAMFHKLDLQK